MIFNPANRWMVLILGGWLCLGWQIFAEEQNQPMIGFTELQCNLPGGRHANVRTMRAMVIAQNGTNKKELAPALVVDENTWTQFAGWSPNGRLAILNQGWQDSENATWEEQNKTFRMDAGKWRLDSYLWNIHENKGFNVTAVNRVSHYNGGLFFLPDGKGLGFTPLIQGVSRPFIMDLKGANKKDVSGSGGGFAYGYSASPDGGKITYHENYQVYIANADGSEKKKIDTGNPFNFGPRWSPDGKWILFLSGKHGASNPYVVQVDGTGLKKIADLGGYQGWILFLDVEDFHQGSSDVPVWSVNGKTIFHTSKIEDRVELCQTDLDGRTLQMTTSKPGTLHYHPQPSPDGTMLMYGSKRDGVRNLFIMDLKTKTETQITQLNMGRAAMWPHWQPMLPKAD